MPVNRLVIDRLMRKAGLTSREIEVAGLVYKGFNAREIAEYLTIEPVTARYHLKNIYKKLDVPSQSKLVGLLNQPDHFDR